LTVANNKSPISAAISSTAGRVNFTDLFSTFASTPSIGANRNQRRALLVGLPAPAPAATAHAVQHRRCAAPCSALSLRSVALMRS
jgi:hypothetical protein